MSLLSRNSFRKPKTCRITLTYINMYLVCEFLRGAWSFVLASLSKHIGYCKNMLIVEWGSSPRKLKVQSKIEKVLRGIRGEKSSKDMANSRNLV